MSADAGNRPAAMRIAVTGASGFVGRAVLRAGTDAGHAMIAVARGAAAGSPDAGSAGGTRTITDITDTAGLVRAFATVDAVVHLAARVHIMHHEGADALARFRAVNVSGTAAVLEAARAAGVKRLAYLSTAKVLGEGGAGATLRDVDPLAPQGGYATSKAEAEELVASVPTGELGWTILRPPLVYGPGVGGNFRRLLRLADIGGTLPIPLGGVRNARSLVYVGNLADALLRSLLDPRAVGRRYLVSDGEDLSTAELLRRMGDVRGRPVRLLALPPSLIRMTLVALGRGAEAARLLESFSVDSSAIRAELDWTPPFRVSDALKETLRWWSTQRERA